PGAAAGVDRAVRRRVLDPASQRTELVMTQALPAEHRPVRTDPVPADEAVIDIRDLSLWYGDFQALHDISLTVPRNRVTALIGASGSGKSTLLRCVDRMNDLVPGVRIEGELHYEGIDLYDAAVDPVEVRRRVGMV